MIDHMHRLRRRALPLPGQGRLTDGAGTGLRPVIMDAHAGKVADEQQRHGMEHPLEETAAAPVSS